MTESWWCAACGAWRKVRSLGSVGRVCEACGSGRVRPPARGEVTPDSLAPLSAREVRAELES